MCSRGLVMEGLDEEICIHWREYHALILQNARPLILTISCPPPLQINRYRRAMPARVLLARVCGNPSKPLSMPPVTNLSIDFSALDSEIECRFIK